MKTKGMPMESKAGGHVPSVFKKSVDVQHLCKMAGAGLSVPSITMWSASFSAATLLGVPKGNERRLAVEGPLSNRIRGLSMEVLRYRGGIDRSSSEVRLYG